MNKPIIAPSLLAAPSDSFGAAIAKVEKAGAQYLHIDIMDGHFVPNITFGPCIVEGIRAKSSLYFDVHLMITNPEKYALQFIEAGADCITVHVETTGDIEEVIKICEKKGVGFGVSLKPNTSLNAYKHYYQKCEIMLIMSVEPGYGGQKFKPDATQRIAQAKQLRDELGAHYKISVDGGINPKTAAMCVAAGADILVAGNAVFHSDDPVSVINQLRGEI